MKTERFKEGHEERFSDDSVTLNAAFLKADEKGPARFDMLAYTGVDISRGWGRMVVNVDGIGRDATSPMLLEHNDMMPVAVCESHKNEKGKLRLKGYMLSAAASPEAGQMVLRAKEGLPYKASIGIRFRKTSEIEEGAEGEVNGLTFKGPMTVVDECHLFECSFIHCNPADLATNASMLRAEGPVADIKPEITVEEKARLKAERDRLRNEVRAEIETRAKEFAAAFPAHPKHAQKCLDAGMTVIEAKAALTDKLAAKDAKRRQAKKVADAALAVIASHTDKTGLGFDASRGETAGSETRFKGVKPEERARIEVGEDPVLARLWGSGSESILALAHKYEGRLREDSSPLYSERMIEAAAQFLRDVADPRWGALNRERLAGYGKSGPDYSKVTVKGFIGSFYTGFETEEVWASKLGFRIESNQEAEIIRWLGQFPQMQAWRGSRQEKGMPVYALTVINDLYEASIALDKNDFKMQKFGLISTRMGQAGAIAARHWNLLLTKAIEGNATAYDGQSYFSGLHTLGGDSGTMQNDCTSTGSNSTFIAPSLAVNDVGNVKPLEFAQILLQLTPHIKTFRAANGEPINEDAKRFGIMCHPTYEGGFEAALRSERLDLGQTNPLHATSKQYELISNPRLTNTKYGYLFRLDTPNMPFIISEPGPPEILFQGPGSQMEYEKHKYGFGLESTRSVVGAAWESALRFTIGAA